MSKYNLNQLGNMEFERLCQSLLKEIIGNGTTTFGAGKDGAREATFNGKAPYPSTSEQWDGQWIFQAKFHDTEILGTDKARKMVLTDLKAELNTIAKKYKYNCDNYILITNVPLSSVYNTGNHDRITKEIVPMYRDDIKNIHVWGADELYGYLDKYSEIRKAFDLITLADWIEMKKELEVNYPDSDNLRADANFPNIPNLQIPRDTLVRSVTKKFNVNSPIQTVTGARQTGKTNFLAQFARQHSDNSIYYFINPSPLTQTQYAFLFSLCQQMSKLLDKHPPPDTILIDSLMRQAKELFNTLRRRAKAHDTDYYLIIDGLEWALEEQKDGRIIDLFPLFNSTTPYMLFSCRLDRVDKLPENFRVECINSEMWAFNQNDTHQYFGDLLTTKEIDKIHRKYNGIPGYLNIVKQEIQNNPDYDIDAAPEDLNTLIKKKVQSVINTSSEEVRKALSFLTVSPVPLSVNVVAELVSSKDAKKLIESLKRTELIKYNTIKNSFVYTNELIQEIYRSNPGNDTKKMTQKLLEYAKVNLPDEDMLLDFLQTEIDDYEGLQDRLTEASIIKTIEHPRAGVSSILRRLHSAMEMAHHRNDVDGLIKWSVASSAIKSFISQAVSEREIHALIAIGYSQKAVSKALNLPEFTSQIRLLSRIYKSMEERYESVPDDALDSLKAMVESLKIKDLDRDIAQEITIDLFPVLPDLALSLLEKVLGQSSKQNLVETAIETIEHNSQEQAKDHLIASIQDRISPIHIRQIVSKWLTGLSIDDLLDRIEAVEINQAKEYIVRQWCKHNRDSQSLVEGIELWQENAISNRDPISLRNLRQITELIVDLSVDKRKRLIPILEIPEFLSINSPIEEWVRVRLNLAEARFEFDSDSAQEQIDTIFNYISQSDKEVDEQVFCFARLLRTVIKITPANKHQQHQLQIQFQEKFDLLREHSAEQFELIRGVLRTLVDIDPNDALIVATELNTWERKNQGIQLVLIATLSTQGNYQDFSELIKDGLEHVDQYDRNKRNTILVTVIDELEARDIVLLRANLDSFADAINLITDSTLKSEALGKLAVLMSKVSKTDSFELIEQAISFWNNENDVRARLSWGYELVECISTIDIEYAKRFFSEVEQFSNSPSAILAKGDLGVTYIKTIDLAIRAINIRVFSNFPELLNSLEALIDRIPSPYIQINRYAQLAASAYRSGYTPYAERIIKNRVISRIRDLPLGLKRDGLLEFCLPIIFEYDPNQAKFMVQDSPVMVQNRAWYFVVLWSLTQSFLGDHLSINTDDLRANRDYKKTKVLIEKSISKINHDTLFYLSIKAVANSVKTSFFSSILEQGEALDILRMLDEVTDKNLPDKNNIQHKGYLILAQTIIHGVRSSIFRYLEQAKGKSPRGLKKAAIRKTWINLSERAKKDIPNIADKIFVAVAVAKHIRHFYDKDKSYAKDILKYAESQVKNIPTLLDRVDRLEEIGETWEALNNKDQAEYIIKKAIESTEYLKRLDSERRLKKLVQIAYKLDPNFADKVVSELDENRLPNSRSVSPNNIQLQIEKLVKSPTALLDVSGSKHIQEAIFKNSSHQLIMDLVAGKSVSKENSLLEKWLVKGIEFSPDVNFSISNWVVENLNRSQSSISDIDLEIFIQLGQLSHQLAQRISANPLNGIPESIQDSFPILNSKTITFNAEDKYQIKKWIQNWFSRYVKLSLKISDSNFISDSLDYLRYLPEECETMIITTPESLDMSQDQEILQTNLKSSWRSLSSSSFPKVYFYIFPLSSKNKLRDGLIITQDAGLNIKQSLTNLGDEQVQINILTEAEINKLEEDYFKNLLDSSKWPKEHSDFPRMFRLDG